MTKILRRIIATVFALVVLIGVQAQPASAWWDLHRAGPSNALNGGLQWLWYDGSYHSAAWRAGSGNGNTNECASGQGWLPTGQYGIRGHWDQYAGSAIKGYVWWLDDKPCYNGVWRTELFIHTEQTINNGQQCAGPYIEPQCWEGDGDFYSAGCIKVSHWDIPTVHHYWTLVGWTQWAHGSGPPYRIGGQLFVYYS